MKASLRHCTPHHVLSHISVNIKDASSFWPISFASNKHIHLVHSAAAECGSPATWGQVCIAMLIQRASDKAAAVRARAISNLASVIEHRCAQKTSPPASSLSQFRQVLITLTNVVRF